MILIMIKKEGDKNVRTKSKSYGLSILLRIIPGDNWLICDIKEKEEEEEIKKRDEKVDNI